MDYPNAPLSEVVFSQACAILFLLGVYGLGVLINLENRQPVAPRKLARPRHTESIFDDNHGRGLVNGDGHVTH